MIVVIGCGRVGLPLCLFLAGRGLKVTGVDLDLAMLESIKNGQMPFLEKGAQGVLARVTGQGLFSVTGNLGEVAGEAKVFIITVGTPLNENFLPSQEVLMDILREITTCRSDAVTVFLRSTIAPGTSEIIRQEMRERGFAIGHNLYYAYCPERIAEGSALEELGKIPQIIGAFDNISAGKAVEFFTGLGIHCVEGSPAEAELAKLFNNMYRYVNFALANQCMYLAEKNNASTPRVLEMCSRGYPRGGPWRPGYAAGPCLYKDGFFLTNQLLFTDLMFSSWKINESLPGVLLKEVESIRPLGRVALLGMAFKAGVDDTRNSPGVKLRQILASRGVGVAVHDPLVKLRGSSPSLEEALADSTEIFVMVPHDEYRALTTERIRILAGPEPLIVDPWFLWSDRLITLMQS